MPWTYLDDKFHSNGKVTDAGNAATGLFARALSYCGDHGTDGFVRGSWVNTNGSLRERKRLTEVDLWRPVNRGDQRTITTKRGVFAITMPADGYYIDDYLELNPSSSEIAARRERQRQGGKKGANARWNPSGNPWVDPSGDPEGEAHEAHGESHAPPPQPLSSKEEAPTRDAAPLEGTITNEFLLARLAATAGGRQARDKIDRALHGYTITEADLVAAQIAATGPGVNDRLAVALAELTKRRKSAA